MVIFHSYVSLPEGNTVNIQKNTGLLGYVTGINLAVEWSYFSPDDWDVSVFFAPVLIHFIDGFSINIFHGFSMDFPWKPSSWGPKLWKPPSFGSCHTMKSPPSDHRLAAPRLGLRDARKPSTRKPFWSFLCGHENHRKSKMVWWWYGEPQNSWDLWMFIPLKMVLIGIDPYPYSQKDMVPEKYSVNLPVRVL